jgi:hypothetical protein
VQPVTVPWQSVTAGAAGLPPSSWGRAALTVTGDTLTRTRSPSHESASNLKHGHRHGDRIDDDSELQVAVAAARKTILAAGVFLSDVDLSGVTVVDPRWRAACFFSGRTLRPHCKKN